MSARPGRKPLENRDAVRTTHVTIKVSAQERATLLELVEARRKERHAAGFDGVFTVSAFVRELVAKEARRRRLSSRARDE